MMTCKYFRCRQMISPYSTQTLTPARSSEHEWMLIWQDQYTCGYPFYGTRAPLCVHGMYASQPCFTWQTTATCSNCLLVSIPVEKCSNLRLNSAHFSGH